MIEVEKRYQLTDEQERVMLEGAEFQGEKTIHDAYYDYPDYRLTKKAIRLRKRGERFELKIRKEAGVDGEVENEKEIADYFDLNESVTKFVEQNLIKVIGYTTTRRKYKKAGFTIDIDDADFGYKICEIELLVNEDNEVGEAISEIKEFAEKYGFENQKTLPKRVEYLKRFKPEVYRELYGK